MLTCKYHLANMGQSVQRGIVGNVDGMRCDLVLCGIVAGQAG